MTASQLLGGAMLAVAAAGLTAAAGLPLSLDDPLTGEEVDLRAGTPALHLVFFATWCPPCVEELERLAELEARWEERGYRLVLIAVRTRHTPERLARFAAERGTPGQLLFDSEGRAEKALGGEQLPTHYLYDAAGKELHRAAALDDGVVEALENLMWELERAPERGR
jgi:thiol-disulfide isomerase/thioredoxin